MKSVSILINSEKGKSLICSYRYNSAVVTALTQYITNHSAYNPYGSIIFSLDWSGEICIYRLWQSLFDDCLGWYHVAVFTAIIYD